MAALYLSEYNSHDLTPRNRLDRLYEVKGMLRKARNYEDSLLESLKEPAEAAAYLNAHLDDDGDEADALFLLALRDVVRAHGFTDLARKADLGRESLYKALARKGNPKLATLRALLDAVGLRLSVDIKRRKAS